jgi:hypothetical protein
VDWGGVQEGVYRRMGEGVGGGIQAYGTYTELQICFHDPSAKPQTGFLL